MEQWTLQTKNLEHLSFTSMLTIVKEVQLSSCLCWICLIEYNCINNLGHWTKKDDPQILALTASLHTLQIQFSSLQCHYQALLAAKDKPLPNTPPPPTSGKLNKPPARKEGEPEVIEFESRTWKRCDKFFGGTWNRSHITEEHQPGKGHSKNRCQPDANTKDGTPLGKKTPHFG